MSEDKDFEMGEPEYIGKFPIRQDITVLPADDPKKLRLNWYALEGGVILKDEEGFSQKEDYEDIGGGEISVKGHKNRLKSFEDIKVGDVVYSTWYDGTPVGIRIKSINEEDETAWSELSDCWFASLSFNKDIRGCWCCSGYNFINTDAIVTLSLNSNEGEGSEKEQE